ncbi:uncharacterized protein CBL_12247 [Carabus blaptoides fortunei]
MKHILLTGLPGSGKTTLVRKVCEVLKAKNILVMGFYTEELRNESKSRIGFDIVTLDEMLSNQASIRNSE